MAPIIDAGYANFYGRDVTGQKQAEESLQRAHDDLEQEVEERTSELRNEIEERKKAEQTYHAVFDAVHDAIFIIDGETGTCLDMNDHAYELFGYTINELQKLGAGDQSSSSGLSTTARLRAVIAEVWNTAMPQMLELEIRDKPGRTFWIYSYFKREVIGGQPRILAVGRDITERKKAEEKVRAASLYSRSLIEASLDPLVTINAEGKITDVNKATEEVTGVSRKQLIGTDFCSYFTEPEKARRVYQQVFTEGFVREYPLAIRHTSGRSTDVLYHATAYRNETGEIQGVFATAWDITELKRAEENLRRAHNELEQTVKERTRDLQVEIEERKMTEKELRRSNKELEQFAYIASHDLKEPLRTVTSSLGLIESWYKNKLGAEADTFITYAVDGAKQMQQLIKDLLEYSRVTTRGEVFAPVNCSNVVQSAIENLKVSIEESEVKITLPDKPLPTVVGDKTQLTQLFQNLIGNAIKFRSEQLPEVQIDVGLDGVGNTWQFSIKDNGIGMDMEYADKIFTIFQRLHTTEQYKGTGVGLALCKKIIERHNGEIWVDSKLGKGSTFYFTLPFYGE